MNEYRGNITTIIKFIVMSIAPAIGMDEATGNTIITVLSAVAGFILAYLDAMYPNTIFSEDEDAA